MKNIFSKFKKQSVSKEKIFFIVESRDWVIKSVGIYITSNINKMFGCDAEIRMSSAKIKNSVIHFGSKHLFLSDEYRKAHHSNKIITTWYHKTETDEKVLIENPDIFKNVNIIHTSCNITKKLLLEMKVPAEKICVIPLGVDLKLFLPVDNDKKNELREKYKIPSDHIIIGSFQKDGNGWGEGDTPKMVKGPDLFCDAAEKLSKKHKIFVLLTGPARGYVKKRLTESGIPFKHVYLKRYEEIVPYYQMLDFYIISSRAEGGPLALLECMACGVPVVSTKVGMAPELIVHKKNGLLAGIENTEELFENSSTLIGDKNLQNKLRTEGLNSIKNYDWTNITKSFYEKIYSKLLND